MKIKETFRIPGTKIIVEKGQILRLEESRSFLNKISTRNFLRNFDIVKLTDLKTKEVYKDITEVKIDSYEEEITFKSRNKIIRIQAPNVSEDTDFTGHSLIVSDGFSEDYTEIELEERKKEVLDTLDVNDLISQAKELGFADPRITSQIQNLSSEDLRFFHLANYKWTTRR